MVEDLLHGNGNSHVRGRLQDRAKPTLLAMSRLDYVKNVSGLLQWFAECKRLQEQANLVIVGGQLDPEASSDREEADQIRRIHRLLDDFELDERVRWIPMQSDKRLVAEIFRCVADSRGAFVQPALFEAFGLTVIEAMSSGLPTFATCYGGPLETIEDGISGFHIDPNDGSGAATAMTTFLERCREEPDVWHQVSQAGLDRIANRYTWKLYANRLLKLARIYGFWKYFSQLDRQQNRRYLEMFHALMYRPLAEGRDPNAE